MEPSGPAGQQSSVPELLDVSALQSLANVGFSGGRNNFREFCRAVFIDDAPRFLRTDDSRLVVFRHADLRALAVIPELGNQPSGTLAARTKAAAGCAGGGSDEPYVGAAMVEVFANQFFFNNEPIHAPLRRMTLGQIGPKTIPRLEQLARSTVQNILEDIPDGATFDFVPTVATQLTVRFWGALIGLNDEEMIAMVAVVRSMSPAFSAQRDAAALRRADDAFSAYLELIERAALRSLAAGDNAFVDGLAAELAKVDLADDPDGAGIVPKTVGTMLAGVLTDGFHTAAVAAVNAVWVLGRHKEVMAEVRANPAMLPAAIAEAWRLEPPALMFNRHAIDDVVYDGILIPKRTGVLMMWGAGNLDPDAFPNPERFDLSRGGQGLTTFGGGAQICPGRHVAAMLTRVLIEGLEAAGLEVEPMDETDAWIGNHILSELRVFPARLRRRAVD